jgi:ArsR family metal-binding transcriptional regulator
MLIASLRLMRTLPCLAEPGRLIVIGESDQALDGVMPLMNAVLPNVISYNPMAGILTLRRQPGLITFYPQRVMITQVADVAEGLELLAAARELVNRIWERRDEIQPKPEGRQVPRPLDIYELLPRSNCGACGEATCMAFAFGLLEARHRPEECAGLAAPQASAQLQTITELLSCAGATPDGRNLHALD